MNAKCYSRLSNRKFETLVNHVQKLQFVALDNKDMYMFLAFTVERQLSGPTNMDPWLTELQK